MPTGRNAERSSLASLHNPITEKEMLRFRLYFAKLEIV